MIEETWKLNGVTTLPRVVGERRSGQELQKWRKPPIGTVKVNCDATWLVTTRKGRTSVVARKWERIIIVGRNIKCSDTCAKKM